MTPEVLAAVPSERLAGTIFIAHPSTRIVRSNFAAVAIFVANRAEGLVGPVNVSEPEDAVITRPDLDVVVRRLPDGSAVFLTHLASGETLGEAASVAFETTPLFDLSANIAGVIEAGAFTTIRRGDR